MQPDAASAPPPGAAARKAAAVFLAVTFALIPLNSIVCYAALDAPRGTGGALLTAFVTLALAQLASGLAAFALGVAHAVQLSRAGRPKRAGVLVAVVGLVGAAGALVGGTLGYGLVNLDNNLGSAWGRPVRDRCAREHAALAAPRARVAHSAA